MKCRFCRHDLHHEFIDLVNAPPSNSFLTEEQLNRPEVYYPLKLFVCDHCRLVQIDEYKHADEIFSQEYVYFSSFSKSWLEHAKKYTDMIVSRFGLDHDSHVVEIASNDGYLLQYFVEKGIPCLGIEPTENTANVAREKGIPVISEFFGEKFAQGLAEQGKKADLLIGNNVLAHVPDVNDFVKGLQIALKSGGVITMEFPHLMQLVAQNQFDTIYHEHFSYFSFHTVREIFRAHKLEIFDVEELPTHGGSLRIYARHRDNEALTVSERVVSLLNREMQEGMLTSAYYQGFQKKADAVKYRLLAFLTEQKRLNRKIAAYGAAAKGNTLLNYCGVKKDMIAFVADASPHKQGMYLPGSHIPVVSEDVIRREKPDYVLVLPWNIKEEIIKQLSYIREGDGKFVIPVPELQVI